METDKFCISIGRELGSGGKSIALILGRELGVQVYDNRLLQMAAEENGFSPEIFKSADETSGTKGGGAFGAVSRIISSPFSHLGNMYGSSMNKSALFRMQSDIIYNRAKEENCIMVGRCADYILRTHPRHLRVFVRADVEDRVRRICERDKMNRDDALALIGRIDRQRRDYHDFYCETNWGCSSAYDLCVNSSLLGIDETARFVLDYARRLFGL